MHVVRTIQPDIKVADDVDRFLVGGNALENSSKFIKEFSVEQQQIEVGR